MLLKDKIFNLALFPFLIIIYSFLSIEEKKIVTVEGKIQTEYSDTRDDRHDDPAIWVHPKDPSKSIVFAADKGKGLYAYNLQGKRIGHYYFGSGYNNVDVAYSVKLNDHTSVDLLLASTKSEEYRVEVLAIDPDTQNITSLYRMNSKRMIPYGICNYRNPQTGRIEYVVTGKEGGAEHYELIIENGQIDHKLLKYMDLKSTNEGCVIDHFKGLVYIAEENVGIWQFDLNDEHNNQGEMIIDIAKQPEFAADIEGLTMYYKDHKNGYLIASVQGKNQFAVIDRHTLRYLFSFSVTADQGQDAVTQTDGIDVLGLSLGPDFPHGIFITQDNSVGSGTDDGAFQNMKFVSWKAITDQFKRSAQFQNIWNPRTVYETNL